MTDFPHFALPELTVNYLKSLNKTPRVHGNGFIQLDLTERVRLHIWGHPMIPRQTQPTPIHNHVFGFKSWCLVGRLVNVEYELELGGTEFQVYEAVARVQEDTILALKEDTVGIRHTRTTVTVPGVFNMDESVSMRSSYYFKRFKFHEIFVPEPTITVMMKDGPTLAQGAKCAPQILVPTGRSPDNTFNRYDHDPELLWGIIRETIDYGKAA
jgi:hypothetical protein